MFPVNSFKIIGKKLEKEDTEITYLPNKTAAIFNYSCPEHMELHQETNKIF